MGQLYNYDENGDIYIVSTGIDITNLKNTEKQLEGTISDLTAANEELTAQQEEPSAMNEELMAQEEELRNSLAELQNHQEMLKKSEERYKLVVEGASDGLWDWDIMTNTAYISERWKNAIGLEKQEISDYYETFIKRVHPGDVKKVVKNLDTHIKEKTQHYAYEYRIKLRNGKYIWILSRGKALWDNEGKAVRMAGSHTDIY